MKGLGSFLIETHEIQSEFSKIASPEEANRYRSLGRIEKQREEKESCF